MQSWARRSSFSYQVLYRVNKHLNSWSPDFDPSIEWTFLGHNSPESLMEKGIFDRKWLDGCFKFVFIRNTWDRLVSFYECLSSELRRAKRKEWDHLASFGAFVRFVVSEEGKTLYRFQLRQLPWLDCGVDFVGLFDRLDEDWKKLCGIVGVCCRPLKKRGLRISKSPRDWRSYYDDELGGIVADFYADEIKQFGFKFGEK